jgi:hypothetical protein
VRAREDQDRSRDWSPCVNLHTRVYTICGQIIWHNFGTLAASKRHQAARPRTTKSLCLQVVGCACWCEGWTFNPPVDGSTPSRPTILQQIQVVQSDDGLCPWPSAQFWPLICCSCSSSTDFGNCTSRIKRDPSMSSWFLARMGEAWLGAGSRQTRRAATYSPCDR